MAASRLPRHQPALVAQPDLADQAAKSAGGQRAHHHPLPVQAQAGRCDGIDGWPNGRRTSSRHRTVTSSRCRRRITATTAQQPATTVSTSDASRPGLWARSTVRLGGQGAEHVLGGVATRTNGSDAGPPISTAAIAVASGPRDVDARRPATAGNSRTTSSKWSTTTPIALVSSSGRGGSDDCQVVGAGCRCRRAASSDDPSHLDQDLMSRSKTTRAVIRHRRHPDGARRGRRQSAPRPMRRRCRRHRRGTRRSGRAGT